MTETLNDRLLSVHNLIESAMLVSSEKPELVPTLLEEAYYLLHKIVIDYCSEGVANE